MELAILGDTHMPRGTRALPAVCLDLCRAADAILHTGDLIGLEVLDLLRTLGPPVHAVHGNVDGPTVRAVLPETLELDVGGVRVGMLHIPGPADGRTARLRARFPTCDAVLFGHTHQPEHGTDGAFQTFNPGSPTERRRAPRHTMGVATIADGRIAFRLVDL